MQSVVLAAELGVGLGHVAPLLEIARSLTARFGRDRVRPVLAVHDPVGARALAARGEFAILAAPRLLTTVDIALHTSSYAEILVTFGFSRPALLTNAVSAWDDLFAILQPDLLIADHSPTACLAARGRIPTIAVGNGFTLPPDHLKVFPALRAGAPAPSIQGDVLRVVNEVLGARSVSPLPALPALFGTEGRAVFTLPQLDPYDGLRREQVLGSYLGSFAPMPAPEEKRIFVYAGASPGYLDHLAQILARLNCPVEAYLGPDPGPAAVLLKGAGAIVHDQPPPLGDVLRSSSVVVSHGGAGLSHAALMAGRPHVILPLQAEAQITAERVERLGAGVAFGTTGKMMWDVLSHCIDKVVSEPDAMQKAQDAAWQVAAMTLPEDPHAHVLELADLISAFS